jgi:ABC-type cobalamin/Fe3+-siderophores transport system ATPase subunit
MKILKFETRDHSVLGNCSLDFSRGDKSSDFVLIAGSNGSGKTTILNEIFDFLSSIYPRNQADIGLLSEV